ncbi:MAG: carbohydrate ABC transporter permease [Chloroflexota bacterium]
MPKTTSTSWKVITYVLLGLWLLFAIVPLFWMVGASIKSPLETNTYPPTFIPRSFSLQNFGEVLRDRGFGGGEEFVPTIEIGDETVLEGPALLPGIRPFWNSLKLGVVTTSVSLVISTMAGYVLATYRFPLSGFMRGFVLLAQQIPIVLLIVPLFLVLSVLRLAFTFWGVALALIVLVTPFNTWLMLGYFKVMPRELIDSAEIDGASQFTTFWRIMLPLAAPGLATAAIFSFTRAWNEFLLVLALSRGQENLPYTVGLYNFFGEYGSGSWHLIAAAALMASLPVLLIFTVFQKYFIAGLTGGAVKS